MLRWKLRAESIEIMVASSEWVVTKRELETGAWQVYWHVANPPHAARRWEDFTCDQLLCASEGDAVRLSHWLRDLLRSGGVDAADEQAVTAEIKRRWSGRS